MHTLILGGTVFLGRHVVDAALAAGHSVTVLTRGLAQPHLFPGVTHVVADRDGGLGALPARRWDAIIDTCGFVPRVVAQSAALACDRYVFVSSVSAYADLSVSNPEHGSTLRCPPDEDVVAHHGALKAECERVVLARPGGIVVRAGLLAGPLDPTGRFTYWPVRLAAGGEVLAPGPASAPVQVIDARDLATFLVRLAESGAPRAYNAVGDETTLGDALRTIAAAVGADARLVWAEGLTGVDPWTELPLWVGDDPAHAGMMRTPNTLARAAGLALRPLSDTARDTLLWARTRTGDPPRQLDGGHRLRTLTRDREATLLAARAEPKVPFFDPTAAPDAVGVLPPSAGEVRRAELWRLHDGRVRPERGGLHDEHIFANGAWGHIFSRMGVPHPTLVRAAWAALGWSDAEGQADLRRYATDGVWDGVEPIAALEAAWGRPVRVHRIPVPPRGMREPVIAPGALDPAPSVVDRAFLALLLRVRRLDRLGEIAAPLILTVNEAILAMEELARLLAPGETLWSGPPRRGPPRLVPAPPRHDLDSLLSGSRFSGPSVRGLAFLGERRIVATRPHGTDVLDLATGTRVTFRHGPARLLGVVGDVAVYDAVLTERLYTRTGAPRPGARERLAASCELGALDLTTGTWQESLPTLAWARFLTHQPEGASLEEVATGRNATLFLDSDRPTCGAYTPGLTWLLALGGDAGPVLDATGAQIFDLDTIPSPDSRRIEASRREREDAHDAVTPPAVVRTDAGVWRLLLPNGDCAEVEQTRREVRWGLRGKASAAAFSPSGELLAVASGRCVRVLGWDGEERQRLKI